MLETSMTALPGAEGAAPLPRGDGLSLWRQIATALEAEILAGQPGPGERLPPEATLAARFGVNRHTLRRAMEALAAEGTVRIEQGRGTFVAEEVVDYRLGRRTRFSENLRAQDRAPGGQILSLGEQPAEPWVAEALRLPAGSTVLRVERLALSDGRPLVLGAHHFPLPRFAGMAAALREQSSISVGLAACGVPDYRRSVTRITARLPSAQEAALLQMPRTRPVLLTEAVNSDPAGVPVDATQGRYAAHRVQLMVDWTAE